MRVRSLDLEIMDNPDMPEEMTNVFHSDLSRMHRIMGDTKPVMSLLKKARPKSVLDIGCGQGALVAQIGRETGARATGVDLKPPRDNPHAVEIVAADATRDLLPCAEIAVSFLTVHHLTEEQTVEMIRNVGRSCERFIIMDLVRHRLPWVLFSVFIAPMLHKHTAADGRQSIRRAFTGAEMAGLVGRAVEGTGARVTHCVSGVYAKQIVDIVYRPG